MRRTVTPVPPPSDRVVVVLIDDETYAREPFARMPRALWTPQLAELLRGMLDAGAVVVGFDVIFATAAETAIRGYDRPFLLALRDGTRAGRVVLAEIRDPARRLAPAPLYQFAIGGPQALAAVDAVPDDDGAVRTMPLVLDGDPDAPFARRLLRHLDPARATALEGDALALDPGLAPRPVPTYSMADLHACLAAGDTAFLRERLGGRIVILGADLQGEDRFRTVNRFGLEPGSGEPAARCTPRPERLPPPRGADAAIPGVFLHAAMIEQILAGRMPRAVLGPKARLVTLAAALAVTLPVAAVAAPLASLAVVALIVAVVAATVVLLAPAILLPVGPIAMAMAVGGSLALLDRDLRSGRLSRRLRQAFALYLPAAEVERIVRSPTPPRLGGEERDITVLFMDIAGFTAMAEHLAPEAVVALLNEHFERSGAAIEAHRGFVEKYLGDGLLAVFGAPLDDPEHAAHAIAAGLACARAAQAPIAAIGRPIGVRIGIASGPVLVGNIGGSRRFNYTVIGDPVNLAARIEALGKRYGTSVLIADTTAAAAGRAATMRMVDRVRVAGREQPVTLFEPAAPNPAYAEAMESYIAGRFAKAGAEFAALAPIDPPARTMAARCAVLADEPPSSWDGTWTWGEK